MATYEQDVMEDLGEQTPEGPSDFFEDEFEEEFEADGFEDELEEEFEANGFEDEFESDGFESEDALESGMADALAADDADEFFGKIFNAVRKAAPIVGKIARFAAPVLSAIPHPAAQIGSKVAGVLGKLRAEGASEEEAFEAVAELAVRDRRALPVVAGLAARSLTKARAGTLSPGQRRQAVATMKRAAQTLVNRGGPKAIRAIVPVTRSVKRTAATKGTPVSVRPNVAQRTIAKVARNPSLVRKLSRPLPNGLRLLRGAAMGGIVGGRRSYSISGPAQITITVS
jgi:hypothetical protein